MLRAVIFDMDGLLIDSEPFWKIAEKKIFATVGIDLTLQMMNQTVGFKLSEVVEYWFQKNSWNTDISPKEEITSMILDEMVVLLSEHGKGKNGYKTVIEFFHKAGWKIGLNSASDYRLIEVVLEKLGVKSYFDIIHSGQDEKYGKPHPGGYISTAQKLGVLPTECLVFEDSLNGILSAKSARMKCIAVPEEQNYSNQKFFIADTIIHSLEDFHENIIEQMES